jgi:pSer/pThr/pTyr-binding forkhead associated (FHA) protein
MSTKLCQNGHVMEATWDRCPYCPDPNRAPRPAVPPTRVNVAPEPAPAAIPKPTPAPSAAGRKGAAKTKMIEVEMEAPVAGWLVVMDGPQKGKDYRISKDKTTIGTADDSDIPLEGDYVSTNHATIRFVNKDNERIFILTDLDSKNGTYLNENAERVAREELVDGDMVTFGKTKCKFKCL